MKRRVGLAAGVLAVAAGAYTAGKDAGLKLKFPYAGEALNAPCDKTVLEYRCEVGSLRCEPLTPTKEWEITHLVAAPKHKGVLIQANIVRTKGFSDSARARWLGRAKEAVYREARARFLTLPGGTPTTGPFRTRSDGPFEDWEHCRIEVYVDGRLSEAKGMPTAQLGR